jgi:hypothetical protein
MHQLAALLLDGVGNCRMRIPQRVDPDSAEQIEISLPVPVDQVHSLPFDKQNRIALISREQQLCFCCLNRFELHATITSVP